MLKKLLLGLLIVVVILLGIGFLLPTEWDVERSILINAPADNIYADVAALRTWPDWTYWNRAREPECKWSFEGPEVGAGAVMRWEGKVHMKGSLTIDAADPAEGISYTLAMEAMDPLEGSIALAPEGEGTRVTWHYHGETNGMPWSNWMVNLFIDSILGGCFEEGLKNLKARAEKPSEEPNRGKAIEASADKDKGKDKDTGKGEGKDKR
jgi:hypothetical protein